MLPEYFHSVLRYINITTTVGKLFYCTALHIYYSFSYVFSIGTLCSSIKMFVRGFQPPRKNHDRTKHLFLLLITDADYLFTAPLRRPQLCFSSFLHKQWSHDPPDLSYDPLQEA